MTYVVETARTIGLQSYISISNERMREMYKTLEILQVPSSYPHSSILVFALLHPQHLRLYQTRHLIYALLTCRLPSSQHFALPFQHPYHCLRICGLVVMHSPMQHPVSGTSTRGNAIHWEGEACEILRASTSAEDIQLVCCYFPFQHPDTPSAILSSRRTENFLTDVDVLGLHKAEETLRTIATECKSCCWDWKWSVPFASSTTGLTKAANNTDKDLLTLVSKVTFMALERKACGFPSRAVEDIFDGLTHVRLLLEYRFRKLDVPKEEYEEVEKV